MRNAIPFKAETVVVLPKERVAAAKALINELREIFEAEYKFIENQVELTAEDIPTPKTQLDKTDRETILSAFYGLHNGVMRMIPAIPTVVETSSNFAIINIEYGKVAIKILPRSSSETMKECICKTLLGPLALAGFEVKFSGDYQGWDPNTDSEILNLLKCLYKEMFGEEVVVKVDHAGLECSIILSKYPHLDVISMGPTIRSPHTTNERCLIETVAPFWELLKRTMEEAPVK